MQTRAESFIARQMGLDRLPNIQADIDQVAHDRPKLTAAVKSDF
jgi:hypothetical protein